MRNGCRYWVQCASSHGTRLRVYTYTSELVLVVAVVYRAPMTCKFQVLTPLRPRYLGKLGLTASSPLLFIFFFSIFFSVVELSVMQVFKLCLLFPLLNSSAVDSAAISILLGLTTSDLSIGRMRCGWVGLAISWECETGRVPVRLLCVTWLYVCVRLPAYVRAQTGHYEP